MTPARAAAPPHLSILPLLADGSLRFEVEHPLLPLLERWLPLFDGGDPPPVSREGAVLRVAAGDPARHPAPAGPPVLRLSAAELWVDDASARIALRGAAGSCGSGDLGTGQVELTPAPGDLAADGRVAWDLFSMSTLAAAVLLGRMHRALVHAAGVVAPDGRAWLLAGDTHAGKSTTSVNLLSAGWRFVSDDNLVLYRGPDGRMWVEGWPRRFHLDEGWEGGRPLHRRGSVDPHQRWPGKWLRNAPLAGLLYPRIAADLPTELSPAPAAEALAGLLRQSPWLLADRACAPEILASLRAACELPAYSLRLGLDSYRDTDRLLHVLAPLWR
jgi:hypothetical protein